MCIISFLLIVYWISFWCASLHIAFFPFTFVNKCIWKKTGSRRTGVRDVYVRVKLRSRRRVLIVCCDVYRGRSDRAHERGAVRQVSRLTAFSMDGLTFDRAELCSLQCLRTNQAPVCHNNSMKRGILHQSSTFLASFSAHDALLPLHSFSQKCKM